MKNGRAIGKSVPLDKRRASINDLEIGARYSLQVVPITDQPGGIIFRTGEGLIKKFRTKRKISIFFSFSIEYDPNRHGHYLPGPKLDVEYTDIVRLPSRFWVENIAGHSALVCWSQSKLFIYLFIRCFIFFLFS